MTRKLLFFLGIVALAAPLQLSAADSTAPVKASSTATISASSANSGMDARPKKKKKAKKGKRCEAYQR